MATRPGRRRGLPIYLLLIAVGMAALAWTAHDYAHSPARLIARASDIARKTTRTIAEAIDSEAREVMAQVQALGEGLESGTLSRDGLESAFREQLASNPDLFGAGVSFAPLDSPARDLFSPYWSRQAGGIVRIQVETAYDYSQPDDPSPGGIRTNWYHEPMARGFAWAEPNYGTVGGTVTITYGERVRVANEAGREAIVFGDFSVGRLRRILSGFRVGDTGYASLISDGGVLIAHPNPGLPGWRIDDLLEGDPILQIVSEAARLETTDPIEVDHGRRSHHIRVDRIPSTGWLLATVFERGEIVPTAHSERRARTSILLSALPLVVGALGIAYPSRRERAWVLALAISALFVTGIGLEWCWSLRFPERATDDTPVYDHISTDAVLARLLPTGPRRVGEGPHEIGRRIPTGIFVQSAKFHGAYNVAVTGYIWQRSDDAEFPGIVLPEAEQVTMTPVAAGEEYIRWYFEADLRQSFDYSTYPIDRESIWIRMWPGALDEDVTLVPDFRAYDSMDPQLKPGLEEDFVLEGWECIGTHFSYRSNSYRVDFGDPSYAAHNERPELYFNIDVQRKFIGPFISDLMPMIVVVILLFAILMIQTRRDEEGLLGFSASTVLSYCSGLFFVLIISHVYVRQKLAVPQIIYVEWFYFTMYGLLLLVSLNAIRFARGACTPRFGVAETECLTLAYWPLTLGTLFLLTLLKFL